MWKPINMAKKKKYSHFTPIFKDVFDRPEWRKLGSSAKVIYMHMKLGYTGSNNGEIVLPYSSLKDCFSSSTFSQAIKELVAENWIVVTDPGGLYKRCSKYKLTLLIDRVFNR